ncbi:unnamed protein product, partial [Ectocarpus sp. 6 AP-2014]
MYYCPNPPRLCLTLSPKFLFLRAAACCWPDSPPLRVLEDLRVPRREPAVGVEPQPPQARHLRKDHPARQGEEVTRSKPTHMYVGGREPAATAVFLVLTVWGGGAT